MDVIGDLCSASPQKFAPVLVLALFEGLSNASAFVAAAQGGRKFRDWDAKLHLLADIWDLEIAIAYGAAGSKAKPPTYPRPTSRPKRQRSIADAFRAAQQPRL